MDAAGHKVMSLVAQHANDFCCQRFVQKLDHRFAIGFVAFGDRAILDMFARAFAQSLNVSQKWFISHEWILTFYFACLEKMILRLAQRGEQATVRESCQLDWHKLCPKSFALCHAARFHGNGCYSSSAARPLSARLRFSLTSAGTTATWRTTIAMRRLSTEAVLCMHK